MRFLSVLLVIVLCTMAIGCSDTLSSLNFQRSSIRGAGDIATTIWLEETSVVKIDETKAELLGVANSIEGFLSANPTITEKELVAGLLTVTPVEYQLLVAAIAATVNVKVEIGPIGPDNVKRIVGFLDGIRSGVAKYSIEDRGTETLRASGVDDFEPRVEKRFKKLNIL